MSPRTANVKNIFIVTKLFKDAICDLILVFKVLYSSFVACTAAQCMRKMRHKAPHFFVVYMAAAMRRHWRYAPGCAACGRSALGDYVLEDRYFLVMLCLKPMGLFGLGLGADGAVTDKAAIAR